MLEELEYLDGRADAAAAWIAEMEQEASGLASILKAMTANDCIVDMDFVYDEETLELWGTDSDTILGLTRKLQGNKAVTFAVNAGTGERIAFALPADYGTPEFHVGGFAGGFYQAQILDFTNGSGFARQYALWLSDQTGLGETTVTVR